MKKIFIDLGHGGTDPGAIGNNLLEKVLTRKIGEYMKAYLEMVYEGVLVKLSRNGDETKSLKQRTDDANDWGADVLTSLHINSATATTANGFESHIYPNSGAPTVALQNLIHGEIMQVMKAFGINNDRGKKQSNFHMLRESNMPACLTENLFIVNAYDANRLKQEEFLKAVGEAHARGVAKFLGLKAKVATVSSTAPGQIRYIYTGGYAGPALQEVHNYLFTTGHNFDCKRAGAGSIVFLIGRFDTSQANFKDCENFLKKGGHTYKLLTEEEALKWR